MLLPTIIAWGMPSGGELIIILVIVLIVFGARRLPELARSLGQAKKEFSKGLREDEDESNKSSSDPSKSSSNGNSTKKG